jgi:hypothetical protein
MYDIIYKKREGGALDKEEIEFFINGYTDGSIPDYQAAALLMAIFLKKMNKEETYALTKAMKNSGDVIDLYPITHLHQRSAQEPDVDHIAFDTPKLHALTHLVEAVEGDRHPTRNAGNQFLERTGDARSHQPKRERNTPQLVAEYAHQHEQRQYPAKKPYSLTRSIA